MYNCNLLALALHLALFLALAVTSFGAFTQANADESLESSSASEFDLASDLKEYTKLALRRAGLSRFSELEQMTEEQVRELRSFGELTIGDLESAMAARNKSFHAPIFSELDQSEHISVRMRNWMRTHGLETVEQLSLKTERKLRVLPGLGTTGMSEIRNLLAFYGLPLYQDLVERALFLDSLELPIDWSNVDTSPELIRILRARDSIRTVGDLILVIEDRSNRVGLNNSSAAAFDKLQERISATRVRACTLKVL